MQGTNVNIMAKFEEYLANQGMTEASKRQYMSQIRQFRKIKFTDNDAESVLKIAGFIFGDNNRCWHRVYAVKHFLMFTGNEHLYKAFHRNYKRSLRPKKRRHLKKSITFDELKDLYQQADEPYNIIIVLQYDTACRVSAILNITIGDIQKDKDGMAKLFVKEKRDQKRTVYISEYGKERLKEYLLNNDFYDKADRIFNVSYWQVWNYIKNLSIKVLGNPISTHWFRTSRAVHLKQKGMDTLDIKNVLGHANIETTLRYIEEAGIESKKLMKKESPEW